MKKLLLGDDASGRPIELSPTDRETHMHVIGSSGSGKSKFLESMMRSDLRNQQGFCLIDPHGTLYRDVLNFCAHRVVNREIILLDLSEPTNIIGFNPFRMSKGGDVSVHVGRRIGATMHAWGVKNTDETPTLERTLRLIYTVLLEQNLPFHYAQFLIDFSSKEIREKLIEKIESSLIKREWQELQQLRARDWRAEILSAKNRLFRLLTSKTLVRSFSASCQIDIAEIIDKGKVLLANLAPSDNLSDENAKVFGALLVNEFFEVAKRRSPAPGRALKPYYLYVDEFQTFVSLAITSMLDEARKRKLFMVLAHQRFGQLDKDLCDAVLTNCRIKAVFGGLPVAMAEMMAQELFIGDLDPKKIKVAIYQTKFWPKYSRDTVYTRSESKGESLGRGDNRALGAGSAEIQGQFFRPGDWLGSDIVGESLVTTNTISEIAGQHSSETEFTGEASGEADVPILLPVPFQELSSVQFFTPEEQLLELTAALKEQFGRHCFIKIHHQKTQPMRVPFVQSHSTPKLSKLWYEHRLFSRAGAVPAETVDKAIAAEERALIESLEKGQGKNEKKDPGQPWLDILGRE